MLKIPFGILTKFSTLYYHVQKCQKGIIQCSFVRGALTAQCYGSSSLHCEDYKIMDINTEPEVRQKYLSAFKLNYSILQNMLFISATDAKDLIKRYPTLKAYGAFHSQTNYRLCINAGIEPELLLKYPMLLTTENLHEKIQYIQRLTTELKLIAPLLLAKHFFKIVDCAKVEESYVPYGNRIIYLSNLFNVRHLIKKFSYMIVVLKCLQLESNEIAEKCIEHTYVFSMPLRRLESILKVLLGVYWYITEKVIINIYNFLFGM